MGNIYVHVPGDATYYKAFGISSVAQREIKRVTEVAKGRHLDRFKAVGNVSAKIIACAPSGGVGMDVSTISLSKPVEFSSEDFSRILNEIRLQRLR